MKCNRLYKKYKTIFNNVIPPSLSVLCLFLLQVEYVLKKDEETGTVMCLTDDIYQREFEF